MLMREKGKKDAEPVSMGFDEAQAAILAGTHVPVNDDDGKADDEQAESDEQPATEKKPGSDKKPTGSKPSAS